MLYFHNGQKSVIFLSHDRKNKAGLRGAQRLDLTGAPNFNISDLINGQIINQ